MIEEPPLLVIASTIVRPAAGVVAQFRDTPTSFICDAMGGLGALDYRIKPVGTVRPAVGVAVTSDSRPADNLGLSAAIGLCEPGDVLVAATGGYTGCAVAGDLMLGIAKNRGVAAFVTDGLVRDLNDIETVGLPCYAVGVCPNSPQRNGPGTAGLPVLCGGVMVASGDIVVCDRDGVVVVPQGRIGAVLIALGKVREAEAALLAKVRGGLSEVSLINALLAGDRVRWVDDADG